MRGRRPLIPRGAPSATMLVTCDAASYGNGGLPVTLFKRRCGVEFSVATRGSVRRSVLSGLHPSGSLMGDSHRLLIPFGV
jgi:hypothetical protein